MTIYPAPRWFREIVRDWIDAGGREVDRSIDKLFTDLVRAQPANLTLAPNAKSAPATDMPSKWKPAFAEWQRFARSNPQFALSGSLWSWQHLRRTWEAELVESGACIKTRARHWLAHEEKFPVVALAIITRNRIPTSVEPLNEDSADFTDAREYVRQHFGMPGG